MRPGRALVPFFLAACALVASPRAASTAPRTAPVTRAPYVSDTSVGSPNEGHLVGGVALEPTPYLRVFPGHDNRWGLPDLVGLLDRGGKRVAARFPGSVMSVGDLSRRGGGDVVGHHSHESGRDADVGFYVLDRAGKSVLLPHIVAFGDDGRAPSDHALRFDDARNWALVEAWMTDPTTRVSRIFVAEHLKARLLAEGRRRHASLAIRVRAEEAMLQPKGATHDDHFHVRIGCPRGQGRACVEHVTRERRTAAKAKRRTTTRPVLAKARKRTGTTGAKAPPMAGVVPAPRDFDDDREVVAGSDDDGELRVVR